jgi:prolyl-tRNA editing enzyme YbaK/EbsC (Cys-tRNA(Pro) deacylase)
VQRVKGPLDIHRELLAAGVPHEIVRLRGAVQSADEFPDVLSLPPSACVSVRMYDVDGALHALAVPALAPVRAVTLARALGAKQVTPAPVDRVNRMTDFGTAFVSPVCLPADVVLVVDAVLGTSDVLYAATGDSGTVLKIRSRDLLVHTNARVAALTAPVAVPDEFVLAGRPAAAAERRTDLVAVPAG